MVIEKIDKIKIKCDLNGCGNLAEFKIGAKHGIFGTDLYVCRDCLKELNKELSKMFTPQSPTNILKKSTQKPKEKTEWKVKN